ncbi:MAG: hypothetical protein PS018_22530 [bacterium]|nr:hypothetical protein [bacterium]
MTSPYLSIVGWARNDGYTENYVRRIEHAVGILARQLDRGGIDSEIILVEWNPPPDRPLLADTFASFGPLSHVTIRVIVADRRFHVGWQGWQKRGMHGSNAANVGIRRARGMFVTPKALDTFYSEKLIEQIAKRDLDEQAVYRCDRWDVRLVDDAWIDLSNDALLEELARNVEQKHGRLLHSVDWKMRDLHTNACGDFMLMSARKWAEIRGYQRDHTVLCLDADSIALHAATARGTREVCWQNGCHIYKIQHGMTHLQRTTTVWKDWQRRLDNYLVASKRRELAAKLRIWFDYPRRQVRGVEEILAPSIERNFVAKAERFARNDISLVTNEAEWGLARETLPEKILARGNWDVP